MVVVRIYSRQEKKEFDLITNPVLPYGKLVEIVIEITPRDDLFFNQSVSTYSGDEIASHMDCFYLYGFKKLLEFVDDPGKIDLHVKENKYLPYGMERDTKFFGKELCWFQPDGQGNFMIGPSPRYCLNPETNILALESHGFRTKVANGRCIIETIIREIESYIAKLRANGYD